jgi:hypothetical protein
VRALTGRPRLAGVRAVVGRVVGRVRQRIGEDQQERRVGAAGDEVERPLREQVRPEAVLGRRAVRLVLRDRDAAAVLPQVVG